MRIMLPRRGWCCVVVAALGTAGCAGLASHRAAEPGRLPRLGAAPVYPAALQAAGMEGEVELLVPVDPSGALRLSEVRVLRATHDLFRAAVLRALPQWRFTPARRRGGRTVADSVRVLWSFVVTTDSGRLRCPPPAYKLPPCGQSASDTAAIRAPQRFRVDSPRPGALVGTTAACGVALVQSACVGARPAGGRGAPAQSAPAA